ncbi:hypothetical protein BD779DRAFT_400541 [Infundibulicybe gibba]|nr:hypothetical protein BD779DRAFT_400541 [Infundibulicybe gibba]
MPSQITPPPARVVAKGAAQKPQPTTQRKKARVVRRRGRAKGDIESDDEIERAMATDSDTDEDNNDLSSPESDSDSDTEPASEDVIANGISRALTPSTSQSPEDGLPVDKEVTHPPFFPPGGNWSEMVMDENTNGPADLPVIDFAELGNHSITPSSGPHHRKPKKVDQKIEPSQSARPASPRTPIEAELETQESTPSAPQRSPGPSFPRRPPGQTARQAYQHRLESDPSYVPTVGGFWGHDDRLLDKELRSLSGWWRGRWQGRGRGRGFPMRGRGRGGFVGSDLQSSSASAQDDETLMEAPLDVPPIERTWTHDGFEEMKKKEEHRRAAQQPTNPGPSGFRGARGGLVARARSAYGRGSFLSSPTRSRFSPSLHHPGRVWYAMKPELMWTKQHEGYLYLDPSLKPRAGHSPGFRIKLPGLTPEIVRALPHPPRAIKLSATKQPPSVPLDDMDKRYHVHLPKRAGKEKAELSSSIDDTPIEDVFTVRPRLVTANPIPLPTTAPIPASDLITKTVTTPSSATTNISPSPPAESSSNTPPSSLPDPSVRSQLELLTIQPQPSDPARRAQTEEAVLRNPPNIEERASEESSESLAGPRPPLPPLQTTFPPPVPQMSPAFGSPYGYPTLPPGVGVNQHGMAYELATGRPVYLHHPAPVYNPRPMMPFVPGHLQQHSRLRQTFLRHHIHPPL